MNKGSFTKGHKPWNKDKKGIHLSPESEFKNGQNVGEKSFSWKGGLQKPKNDCMYLYDGANKRVRNPRAVYEKAFGKIPKGMVIYHMDGNKHNDELTNLEVITRKELLKRNLKK